jgi:hypothetical protein
VLDPKSGPLGREIHHGSLVLRSPVAVAAALTARFKADVEWFTLRMRSTSWLGTRHSTGRRYGRGHRR